MINLDKPNIFYIENLVKFLKENYSDITKEQLDYLMKDVKDIKIRDRFYKLIQ